MSIRYADSSLPNDGLPNDGLSADRLSADRRGLAVPATRSRAMMLGQHAVAAVLTAAGAVRAIGAGSPLWLAVAAGAVVLAWYALCGVLTVRRRSARVRWWLLGLTVLWLGAVVISDEFVWIAFLLWLLAGHVWRWWPAVAYSLVVFAVVVAAPLAHDGALDYASVIGPLIGGVFAFGMSRGYLKLLRDASEREQLVASLTAAQQRMADLHDELALTQRHAGAVAERTRISRDIHDTLAQSLSSIRFMAHAAASDCRSRPNRAGDGTDDDPAVGGTITQRMEQLESLAAEGLQDVRRIVAALAPAELEDGALPAALRRLIERWGDDGPTIELHVDGTIPALSAPVEAALLRTAQSALGNVRRHAAARRVVISLVDDDDRVRLDVIDDGRGFDPVVATPAWGSATGYGLAFMRSRLTELGGGIDIQSTPGQGAALSAYLPVRAGEESRA